MKLAPFLGTGVALWEMAQELGFNPSKDANGDVSVTRSTGAITGGYRVGLLPYVSTFQAACNAYRDTLLASNPGWTASVIVNVTTCQVALQLNGGSASNFTQPIQFLQSVPPSTAPATLLDLENAIAEKSGWPSTSKLPTALRDAATATGETIDVETPRITGPATSPGTTSTTTNPTNNTTTTNTVTHNHTYNDNRVTNTITRASTVTNNTTGAGTTTTTTEQPVEELSDCEKNPGSIACAELDTPDDEIPKTEKQVSFTPENLGFGGGSCPANVVMTPANMATPITVINWADNCQKITTYAKPMILAMALFAAMMIIFVGKTE
ncbi:MAG: hypothetical protein EAZ11_06670 [Curvibacter sp.]|nr:MAG: hypothetical protein EAZ11_06670 [Curvibacter sp.]